MDGVDGGRLLDVQQTNLKPADIVSEIKQKVTFSDDDDDDEEDEELEKMEPAAVGDNRLPAYLSMLEKTCATTQKTWKTCFSDFEKKRMYSFTGHLITLPLIHNYQKSLQVRKSWTSDIMLEMWTQENAT